MLANKVFSKDKWYESMSTNIWPYYMKKIPSKEQAFKIAKWVIICDGLTPKEMKALGYVEPNESWLVEATNELQQKK